MITPPLPVCAITQSNVKVLRVCVCLCTSSYFPGRNFISGVMPLLHPSAWECWMKRLLSFLFFTIMIVSCSPIYSCQVFLHAINLPHLCTRSVSYSLFHTAQTYVWSVIHLVLILDDMQTARAPLYVFQIQLSVFLTISVIWAARKKSFSPDFLCLPFVMFRR